MRHLNHDGHAWAGPAEFFCPPSCIAAVGASGRIGALGSGASGSLSSSSSPSPCSDYVSLAWNGDAKNLVNLSEKGDHITCNITSVGFYSHVRCDDHTSGKTNVLWSNGGGFAAIAVVEGDATFSITK